MKARQSRGFTLLEVLVALTITSLVMGSLLTLSADSKRLALRAEHSLHRATALRAAVHAARLDDGYRELEPVLQSQDLRLQAGELLPDPPQRTAATPWLPAALTLRDTGRGHEYQGVRWMQFDVPR